jgi:hypothetical protein
MGISNLLKRFFKFCYSDRISHVIELDEAFFRDIMAITLRKNDTE